MRLRSLLFRNIGVLFIALSATQGWAGPMDLVELTGNVGFSSTTGSGGFEGDGAGGDYVETGPFRLIYDPLIPDSESSADTGLFRGAIKSFVMTISQNHRSDLHFSLVGRGDFFRTTQSGTGSENVTWKMMLKEENNVVAPSMFSFHMYLDRSFNPNIMPEIDFWPGATALGAQGGGANETDWLKSGRITARTVPRPVPAPSTLWLLLIGGAAALFPRVSSWKGKPSKDRLSLAAN